MAESILFRAAHIRYADIRRKDEAAPFCRIYFTADLSQPVLEAMGWEEIPDFIQAAPLVGALSAQHLVLTPVQPELQKCELQIECTEVTDFVAAPIKDDEGNVCEHELRFVARSSQPGAAGLVEEYLRVMGSGLGNLKVSYISQGNLDDKPEQEEEPAAVQPGLFAEPDTGDNAGTVASVVQMAGSTAELKKERKRKRVEAEGLKATAEIDVAPPPDAQTSQEASAYPTRNAELEQGFEIHYDPLDDREAADRELETVHYEALDDGEPHPQEDEMF